MINLAGNLAFGVWLGRTGPRCRSFRRSACNQLGSGGRQPGAGGGKEVLEMTMDRLGLLAVRGDVAPDGGEAGGALGAADSPLILAWGLTMRSPARLRCCR